MNMKMSVGESCIIRKLTSFKLPLVVTNNFCHQTLIEGKFVKTLRPVYYVCSIASFFKMKTLCHFKVLLK